MAAWDREPRFLIHTLLRPRLDLALENIALRQQLAVLKTKKP